MPRHNSHRLLGVAALLLLGARAPLSAGPQAQDNPQPHREYTIAVDVNMVVLHATVVDAKGRMIAIRDNLGRSFSFTLDAKGRALTLRGAASVDYGYDGTGRLRRVQSGEEEMLFDYDDNGFPASRHPAGIDQVVDMHGISGRGIVFAGVLFFLLLVIAGLVYEWRKGVLRWR